MNRALLLLSALALSGCAAGPGAERPERVRLTPSQLSVEFRDGSTCRAGMGPGGGAGRFEDCAQAAAYEVRIGRQNLLAPVLGEIVSPIALVLVTDAAGRVHRFRMPPSRDWPPPELHG